MYKSIMIYIRTYIHVRVCTYMYVTHKVKCSASVLQQGMVDLHGNMVFMIYKDHTNTAHGYVLCIGATFTIGMIFECQVNTPISVS